MIYIKKKMIIYKNNLKGIFFYNRYWSKIINNKYNFDFSERLY